MGQKLQVEIDDRKTSSEREASERRQQLRTLSEEVREVHVDGIGLATFGVWFRVIGLVIATLSPELAHIAARG